MGKYYRKVKHNKQRIYEPLEPQPTAENLVIFIRQLSYLKNNKNYRRRITVLADNEDVAVVEYMGTFVQSRRHGNSRSGEVEPYLRTPVETMDVFNDLVGERTINAAYNTFIMELDSDKAPRDSKIVRSKKYNDAKDKSVFSTAACSNFADEWQHVLRQMQTDSFIRFVGALPDKVPNIILNSDRQLHDIEAYCFNCRQCCVLGFGKTYNLGKIFVTVSNYKNLALKRRETQGCPDFLDRYSYTAILILSHTPFFWLSCQQVN